MDWWVWVIIAAAVVVIVAIVVTNIVMRRRREALKEQFGPEYDRVVETSDSRRRAEIDLRERAKRHEQLDLHPLSAEARDAYQRRWRELQGNFVDRPQVAVADSDSLITQVMRDLGYPIDNFESNADLLSVEHGNVVSRYREGHGIYLKTVEGRATTEDLRQAVLAYRVLFEDLMNESAKAQQ
jgi:hypothetical protein